MKLLLFILVLSIFTGFSSCKKDISIPDPALEKLFGKWDWVSTSCGHGNSSSPATTGKKRRVEFKKTGISLWHQNGIRKDKMKFTLTEGKSIFSTGIRHIITYDISGVFKKDNYCVKQSITFAGEDTLFLDDEIFDGCGNMYVRKK